MKEFFKLPEEIRAIVVEHMRASTILANRIYEISKESGASRPLPLGFRLYAAMVPLANRYPKVQDSLFRSLLGDITISDPAVQASLEKIQERESRHAVLLWSKDRHRLGKALESIRFFMDGLGFSRPEEAEYTKTVNNAILGATFHAFNFGVGGTSRTYSVHDAGREWDDRLADVLAVWGQITKMSGLLHDQIILPQDLQGAYDKSLDALANGRIDRPAKKYLHEILPSVEKLQETVKTLITQCLTDPAIASQQKKCELIRESLNENLSAKDLAYVWQVAESLSPGWDDKTPQRGLSRLIQSALLVHTMLQEAETTIEQAVQLFVIQRKPHLVQQSAPLRGANPSRSKVQFGP